MKQIGLILVLSCFLLGSCSFDSGTKKTTYHRLESAQSSVTISFDDFHHNYMSNYHTINSYNNVKMTITSNVPFADEDHDILYGLDKVEYLCVVNHDLDFRPDPLFCGYNLNFPYYGNAIASSYEVFSVNSELFIFLSYILIAELDNVTFTKYSASFGMGNYFYELSYSEDYYLTEIHIVTDKNHKYDYVFDYFNLSDCATAKESIDFETFYTSFLAHSNQPLQYNRVTVKYSGNYPIPVGTDDKYGTIINDNSNSTAEFYYKYVTNDMDLNKCNPSGIVTYQVYSEEYGNPKISTESTNSNYIDNFSLRLRVLISEYGLFSNAMLSQFCNYYRLSSRYSPYGSFDKGEIIYVASPLRVRQEFLYYSVREAEILTFHRVFDYTFREDGLIERISCNEFEEFRNKKQDTMSYTLNYEYSLV